MSKIIIVSGTKNLKRNKPPILHHHLKHAQKVNVANLYSTWFNRVNVEMSLTLHALLQWIKVTDGETRRTIIILSYKNSRALLMKTHLVQSPVIGDTSLPSTICPFVVD